MSRIEVGTFVLYTGTFVEDHGVYVVQSVDEQGRKVLGLTHEGRAYLSHVRPQSVNPDAGEAVDATYAHRDRNAVLWVNRGLSYFPLMTDRCLYCSDEVRDFREVEAGVSRLNGDSRYGYEPYHVDCMEAEQRLLCIP